MGCLSQCLVAIKESACIGQGQIEAGQEESRGARGRSALNIVFPSSNKLSGCFHFLCNTSISKEG